jgi:signal transduction histidine kinase
MESTDAESTDAESTDAESTDALDAAGRPSRRALSLRASLLLGLGYVVLLATVALGVPLALSLQARVSSEVRSQARGQADVVAATAADLLGGSRRRELAALCRSAAQSLRGRVIVVDRLGTVLADSAGFVGRSYGSRPEVAAALSGRRVQVQRPSRTLGEQILATAVPIVRASATVGAVRVTQSVADVGSAVRRVELGLGLIALVVLAIGLAVGAFVARAISRPLLRLERVARRVAAGELDARAALEGSREQRSLSASFNEMADRIARLLRSQREFVADASHQLRTPLTGLRLRLEEAAASAQPQTRLEIDAGIAEVDRLASVVEELLLLSRARERELPGERVMLEEIAGDGVDRWRRSAAERSIKLTFAPRDAVPAPRDAGTAWCTRVDADRALDVLIENALRYSPPGSEVEVVPLPGEIEVRDRGPGLVPGEEADVFKRFHRGSAGRNAPGSGLGLPIARELARVWGGDVSLRRRDGGGTTAVLTLPDRPAPAPTAEPRVQEG